MEKLVIALGGNALGNNAKEQLELVKQTARTIVDLSEEGYSVVVDENDEAFKNLTKPVGMFYTKEEADKIAAEKGYTFVEDAGRGYRRVVASPNPQKIVELETIKHLVENGTIVITVGGGGIPVVKEANGTLYGVDAVIDKDKSSAKLAKDLDAKMLVILTAVDRVCINFNKPNQESLKSINLIEAEKYIKEGHFAKGSMLPKVEACVDFVVCSTNGKALITSLEKAKEALHGETGTIISKETVLV